MLFVYTYEFALTYNIAIALFEDAGVASSEVEPGSTPPGPHLRADSEGGRISLWRLSLLEPFYELRTQISSSFHYSFMNVVISLVLYLFTL